MRANWKQEDFGSPENLLRAIQERSEDIERAVIIPPGYRFVDERGKQITAPLEHFVMMLQFINGERKLIHQDDSEMVLNDGILNRMGIRIDLAKPEA